MIAKDSNSCGMVSKALKVLTFNLRSLPVYTFMLFTCPFGVSQAVPKFSHKLNKDKRDENKK
jgi:hypothetical protein